MGLPRSFTDGKFEILHEISGGGMGALYKVRHLLLDEFRVIKVVRPVIADDDPAQQRFLLEAQAASSLRHPNIAQIHDYAIGEDGAACIVMEFIDGVTLTEMLAKDGPPDLDLAMEIARQSLLALGYLHKQGFIHRDIAPDNLMLTHGFDGKPLVKLIDLGIAKRLDSNIQLTAEGTFIGKARYSAPENFTNSNTLDQRSDIYSFGVMLYELLTGHCPIEGESLSAVIASHLFKDPMGFEASDPERKIPPGLRKTILQTLEKTTSNRIATAEELAQCLESFREGTTEVSPIPSLPQTTWRRTPFVSGRTVKKNDFLGRSSELSSVLGRIDQGESSIVLGHNKSGKSSFLHKIMERQEQGTLHGAPPNSSVCLWMDMDALPSGFTPHSFWRDCLEGIKEHLNDPILHDLADKAKKTNFYHTDLRRLFNHLEANSQRLILLLDEFDRLTDHQNFSSNEEFFARLRSITTHSGSMTIAAASRLSVHQLNMKIQSGGSPMFNHLVDVALLPFEETVVARLLRRSQEFSTEDLALGRRVAGRHPYLLQVFGTILHGDQDQHRKEVIVRNFQERATPFFDEFWSWEGLDNRQQAALLALALAELAGYARGKSLTYDETGLLEELALEFQTLAQLGWAEQLKEGNIASHEYGLNHNGKKWSIGFDSFRWWVYDLVASETKSASRHQKLTRDAGFARFLRQPEWDHLTGLASKIPSSKSLIQDLMSADWRKQIA